MKTIRQKLSEALPSGEQPIYEQACTQIRRMYFRRVLRWFCITATVAAALALAARQRAILSPLFFCAFAFLGGFAALWIMVSVTEQTCNAQRPPAPPPTGEQLTNDQKCSQEQEKLRGERSIMLVGAFFIFPLIPLFLLTAALRAYFIKERPGTAGYASSLYASHLSRRINAVSFFFLPILLMCMVLPLMWEHQGTAKVTSLNQTAHSILTAACTYAESDKDNRLPEWETVIISPNDTAEEGSIQFSVEKYLPDIKTSALWYAVAIDENGSISEVYCSRSPLTESDLTPPDFAEQKRLASSPFHAREVIGYWKLKNGAD